MKGLIKLGVVLAVLVLFACWSAYVTTLLWKWFVVPLGVPPVGMIHVIGLGCLVSCFRRAPEKIGDFTEAESVKYLIRTFLYPTVALGIGYAAHCRFWLS